MVPFSFANDEWLMTRSGALFWPRECALLVADLHLEKASFFARHGQMLPPYDSRETLERVALAIRETGARRVFTLGDNFHDARGAERLEPHAAGIGVAFFLALPRIIGERGVAAVFALDRLERVADTGSQAFEPDARGASAVCPVGHATCFRASGIRAQDSACQQTMLP